LNATFTKDDIVGLFEEEKGEYMFSLLLKNNIISYTKGGVIEFGAPIMKIMFNELCEKRKVVVTK